MNEVITDGREAIAKCTFTVAPFQELWHRIQVTKVNIDRSAPPVQVQDAFNDVQKAKEDRQRFVNQATAICNKWVPEARGRAQRQQKCSHRDRVIARSDGEAKGFEKLLRVQARARGHPRSFVSRCLGNSVQELQ